MTTTLRNFSILNVKGVKVAVTDTTQRIALRANGGEDIMIVNRSAVSIYVVTGKGDVAAIKSSGASPSMEILPGEKGVYSRGSSGGNTTHIAFIADVAGPSNIVFYQGEGI
jgi:hypothetical protein